MNAAKEIGIVGTLTLCALTVGCDDEPADDMSAVVLRDDEITDEPKAFDDSPADGSTQLFDAEGCDIDDNYLWLDMRSQDVNFARRVAPDGDDEYVTVGAWQAPPEVTRRWLPTVARQVDAARCGRKPYGWSGAYTGTLNPVAGLPHDAVAFHNMTFAWSTDIPPKPVSQLDTSLADRRSLLAAYAPVDDYLVFVMLAHFDDSDPDPADLQELLDKAIDKVRDNG